MLACSAVEAQTIATCFKRFLAVHDEPFGGKALYGYYTADAPVSFKYQIRTPMELGADEFALGLAAAAMVHEDEHPTSPRRPIVGEPSLVDFAREADGRVVAWFDLPERSGERVLHAAVGFEPQGEGWRIGWLTLAAAIAPWSYTMGRIQTMADYPYAEGAGLAVPRSWLDVAYYRLYDKPRPAILTLPDARFGCQSSGVCCNIGFNVVVSPAAQALIDAVPWQDVAPELQGTQLPVMDNGRLKLKDTHERCRFLDDNKHCLLHKFAGRAVFTVCAVYPFVLEPTPDGVAVATSLTCPTARGNFGPLLQTRADDIHDRLAMLVPPPPNIYRLAADQEVEWELFKAEEAALLALLDRDDLTLQQRLWLGCRWLDGHKAQESTIPPVSNEQRQANLVLLARVADLFELPLPAGAPAEIYAGLGLAQEAELARMIRNQLFSKRHSFKYGLRTAHHINILMYLLARYVQARHEDGRVPETLLWELGSRFLHGSLALALEHNPQWLDLLNDRAFGGRLIAHPLAV
jgi:hypothetical protein